MNSKEKCELLKDTIYQLYSMEGRSKSYIGRLLKINRKTLSEKINKEWKFPEPEPRRHANPSTRKFINKNRAFIKKRLDNNIPVNEIARELGVTRDVLKTVFFYDGILQKAKEDYLKRIEDESYLKKEQALKKSGKNYYNADLEGEIWKTVAGHENYEVSNLGRVRSKNKDGYILLTPVPNKNNGRLYVGISKGEKIKKNIQLSRLVAFAFCQGHTEERNTVNHKDGNVQNCTAENLEWMSQSENNTHSYRALGRKINRHRKKSFSSLLYKNKYEFKTIESFARFLGKSPTQVQRYLESPEKHEITIIL